MKVRPILFSGPMVRALLDGRKTQTRRILKGTPEHRGPYNPAYVERHRGSEGWEKICPYGQPGDLLWVRETWALASRAIDVSKVYYKAHENASHTEFHEFMPTEKVGRHQPTWPRFKPSIHMPRWASRLTLELTEVRVERLQDISEVDKRAEGATPDKPFGTIWRAINTVPGIRWEDNPWVWCLSFRVHQKNVDTLLAERGNPS